MDFKDLNYMVTVADELNFSRAADKLIVSQPTLSQSISKLEKQAGCPLFLRQQHGLSLTEEGERFVTIAKKLLQLKDEMDDEIKSVATGHAGRIQLGISYTFSRNLVPRVLPVFTQEYPNTEVAIHNETSAVLEKMLLDGKLDVAVLVETVKNKDLSYEVLFYEQVLLAVSPDNPLVKKGVSKEDEEYLYLDPKLLKGQRFIVSEEKMRLRESADAFFQKEGITPEIAVTTASTSTAINLAGQNVGIAFIPASQAEADDEPSKPVYFTTADTLADWKVSIAVKKYGRPPSLLEGFIQAFKKAM